MSLFTDNVLFQLLCTAEICYNITPDIQDNQASAAEDGQDDEEYKSSEQIADELVTLSLLPTSRWLNLLHLDIIKVKLFLLFCHYNNSLPIYNVCTFLYFIFSLKPFERSRYTWQSINVAKFQSHIFTLSIS